MQSMANNYCAHRLFSVVSPPHHHHHHRDLFYVSNICQSKRSSPVVLISSFSDRRPSNYDSPVFQATMLLGPPARFKASKLKVVFVGQESSTTCTRIVPRTYTLSHCDFTANLTLTISNIIRHDQLKGWYNKDDVLAEWTNVRGNLFLDVHCYVSGTNIIQDMIAEFRYYIFSKELPLVLEAVLYGDSVLFNEHHQLMDSTVRIFFHSRSNKFNRVECWGPLKDAVKGRREDDVRKLLSSRKPDSPLSKIWAAPKFIFQALVTLLL